MRDAYTCPRCGSRVTPFAAGCAYCGADLDPTRHRPRTIAARLRGALRGTSHRSHLPPRVKRP